MNTISVTTPAVSDCVAANKTMGMPASAPPIIGRKSTRATHKAASTGTLANPGKLNAFLQAVTKSMTVDKDFSLADMAWQFHGLRSSDLTFMTSPYSGFGTRDGQSVVLADHDKASALYDAVAKDTVASYLARSSASPTPGE